MRAYERSSLDAHRILACWCTYVKGLCMYTHVLIIPARVSVVRAYEMSVQTADLRETSAQTDRRPRQTAWDQDGHIALDNRKLKIAERQMRIM